LVEPKRDCGIENLVACASLTLRNVAGLRFRFLSSEHARDSAHDASHGQFAFCVSKKNFTGPGSAVIPALQQSQMLHGFQRRDCFHWRDCIQRRLHPRFHGLRLGVLRRLNAERNRPTDFSRVNPEECDRSRKMTRLNHQSGESIETFETISGSWLTMGLSFFHAVREWQPRLQRQACLMLLLARRKVRELKKLRRNQNKPAPDSLRPHIPHRCTLEQGARHIFISE